MGPVHHPCPRRGPHMHWARREHPWMHTHGATRYAAKTATAATRFASSGVLTVTPGPQDCQRQRGARHLALVPVCVESKVCLPGPGMPSQRSRPRHLAEIRLRRSDLAPSLAPTAHRPAHLLPAHCQRALLNRLQRRAPSLRSSGPALLLARYLPYLPVPAVPANKGIQLPPPSPARPRGVAVHGQASSPCPSSSLIPSTCRPPRAQPPGQRAREPLALASSAASTRPERRGTQRRRGPPTTWQREAVLWLFRWSSTHTKLGSPSSQGGLRGLGRSGTCPYLAVPVWCAAV